MPLPVPVGHHVEPVPFGPRLSLGISLKRRLRRSDKNRHLIILPECIPVIGLWSLPSAHVNVATVRQIPGLETLFLPVTTPADTRLAYIIKGSPHKITDHIRVIQHVHPACECFKW